MPRRQDDDDFDDDEYMPRKRAAETGGGGMVAWLFIALGVGGAIVVGVIVLLFTRGQRAQHAAELARADAEARMAARPEGGMKRDIARPRPPDDTPPRTVGTNWQKVVGTWSRQPADKEEGGYPYQFEFRNDLSVTMTRVNYDGRSVGQEARAEVRLDQNEQLMLILHVHMGTYSYSFRVNADDTLVLDDGKDGLTFRRAK